MKKQAAKEKMTKIKTKIVNSNKKLLDQIVN